MNRKEFFNKVSLISTQYIGGIITRGEADGMITELCRNWFEDLDICCKDETMLLASVCVICNECGGTGVIETGNNDLPCKCFAGDMAMFNVAGRGQVQGHILKKEMKKTYG